MNKMNGASTHSHTNPRTKKIIEIKKMKNNRICVCDQDENCKCSSPRKRRTISYCNPQSLNALFFVVLHRMFFVPFCVLNSAILYSVFFGHGLLLLLLCSSRCCARYESFESNHGFVSFSSFFTIHFTCTQSIKRQQKSTHEFWTKNDEK